MEPNEKKLVKLSRKEFKNLPLEEQLRIKQEKKLQKLTKVKKSKKEKTLAAGEKKMKRKQERLLKKIDSRPFAEINQFKLLRRSRIRRRINRSRAGDFALFLFLAICGTFSFLPLLLVFMNALKPLDEIFLYPPKFFVRNPTLSNFADLANVLGKSMVPFSRYFFNTIFVTIVGTIGHVIIASMCAYPLAKRDVPGGKYITGLVVYSLMFPVAVKAIPNYLVINSLGLIDTYWAVILPAFGYTLGFFLMRQFMSQIPTSLVESAKLDGASEFRIYWKIIMPLVKPAWLTLVILLFQTLWATSGSTYIYREDLKMVSYALQQIATAGPARQGTLAAVSLIMVSIPIFVFVLSQSQIMETMSHSGIK